MGIYIPRRNMDMANSTLNTEKVVLLTRSFYDGRLTIYNIPFIQLHEPTFTNEKYVKDGLTSLTLSVICEYLKEIDDVNQDINYEEYANKPEIRDQVRAYLDMLG
jgi:hypothetical protein